MPKPRETMTRLFPRKWLPVFLGFWLCWGMTQAPDCLSADRGVVFVRTSDGKDFPLYANSYALVVGNGNYTKGWDVLNGALTDADEVARVLKANGFVVEVKKDLTKAGFEEVFGDFIDRHGRENGNQNRLLFYYAGHGYTERMANNEELGYLVMVDAPDPEKDRAGFRRKSIDMESLITQAKLIQSKHVLFMFDSCFSGTILNTRDRLTPENISDSVKYPVREFITAGRANEPVPDHSIFKQAFLDILEGRAREPFEDGYLTGEELGCYLKNTVPKYYSSQHPQFGKIRDISLDKGDFVFVLKKTEPPSQTPPQAEKTGREPLTRMKGIQVGAVFRDTLKDGAKGPVMVVIPAGSFTMGDFRGDGEPDEKPTHQVTISRPFAMGRDEITFAEYDKFAQATGRALPGDEGWGRGRQPVIHVSWADAGAYAEWLSEKTGKKYRLPTEAEWEYAARSGGKEEKWAGTPDEEKLDDYAWYDRSSSGKTHPVGEKKPNGLGLYDMSGNVWEWLSDCWRENYEGAPENGSAWISKDCGLRVIRGGSWDTRPRGVCSSYRAGFAPVNGNFLIGFRLARDL